MKESSASPVPGRGIQGLFAAAALVIIIAGLREAAEILVPVVFAAFATVVLMPAVRRLRGWGLPASVAILLVVFAVVALMATIASVVGASFHAFAAALPRYQQRVIELVGSLSRWLSVHKVKFDMATLLGAFDAKNVLPWVGNALSQLASVLSYVVFILLMVIFLLFDTVDLPVRLRQALIRPNTEIEQVKLVASEINHYILLKTYLCLATGIATLVILCFLHVDFAPLWALLAFAMGYVPNIGPIAASAPPVLLALLQAGPGHMTIVLGLLVALHTVVGNVVEPQLLGRRLGLSSFVVFVSLIVWGWIWGIGGMLLSVPLTMTLKILLNRSQDWRWLAVLMGAATEAPPSIIEERPSSPQGGHSEPSSK